MLAIPATTRSQFVSIIRISGPLIVNFLAVAGMNLADVTMSGRLGAIPGCSHSRPASAC
jgi:Na+-driven multidrug efflux pump